MKRIFNILLLFIGVGSSAFSQDGVSFKIYAGMQNQNLKTQIEKQTQAFLREINRAALNNSKAIDFRGINISEFTSSTILMLWENIRFKTVENEIDGRCFETEMGYQVRDIEVELIPMFKAYEKDVQEICLEFDKQGRIIDFTFALNKRQMGQVLREGDHLGDISKRMTIINFCEELRMAFLTKNISFIDSVLNDSIVLAINSSNTKGQDYEKTNKKDYIRKLCRLFNRKGWCNVEFHDLKILPHASKPQYYGASLFSVLRMGSEANNVYNDSSRIFMVWEFSEEDNAELRIFCLQPATTPENKMYNIENFNLE